MQNEYANRQNMHLTVLKLIDTPEFEAAWKDQKPTAFTARAAELRPLVAGLTALISGQQTATTGYAETKEREEQELETLAHELGQTLADWYEENGREGDSAQIDLSLSAWQRLRDTELVAKAKLLHQKLTAALAESPTELADYDLAAADATLLAKETVDFEQITADPAAAPSPSPSAPASRKSPASSKRWTASSSASAAPSAAPPSPHLPSPPCPPSPSSKKNKSAAPGTPTRKNGYSPSSMSSPF